ncbi:MAG: hypothetical protein QXN37_04310 [Candidatus Anstonellaceae archaeon]
MAIFRINKLQQIASSKDPKDKAILEFTKRHNIPTLSYKDYKYLYCLLCAEEIGIAVGGHPLRLMDEQMKFWLSISRADRQNELSGKVVKPKEVPAEAFAKLQPLLEAEINAPNLSSLVLVREKIGEVLSALFIDATGGKNKARFWENISVSMMLLDTLSDLIKDRLDGLVKRLDFRGFVMLIRKLAERSLLAVAELGLISSVRLLFIPSIMTIKGGFESERKKEAQCEIHPAFKAENIPKSD